MALEGKLIKRIFWHLVHPSRILLLLLVTRIDFSSPCAQELNRLNEGPQYYLQLKNEEFLQTMIPKEKYLLGLVQRVNEEIINRKSEGLKSSDLGIDDLFSPEEVIVNEYAQEYESMLSLLDEISRLERTAKRKVDLKVLEALAGLKAQVHRVLMRESLTPIAEVTKDSIDSKDVAEALNVREEGAEASAAVDASGEQYGAENLFEQWRYTGLLDYKVKLAKYELLRARLLRTATPAQENRMFQRSLRHALENYSLADFLLSRLQFKDILNTFGHDRSIDDIIFYLSESSYVLNYFDEAIEGYQRLVREYPESSFYAKAFVKLIHIYYIYGEFEKLSQAYQQVLLRSEQLDAESMGAASYLVGYAYFKAGEYEKALSVLGRIDSGTTYFFPALYMSAACYSNTGNDDLALSIYNRLIDEKSKGNRDPVFSQLRNNALLKLGLIYYERGENNVAVGFLNRVAKDFEFYDLSVMGRAWSAYRSGRPAEALRNVQWLLRNSMASNYLYEAKVLAANSKQLLGHSEEAIDDLKQVFRLQNRLDPAGVYPPGKDGILDNPRGLEEFESGFIDNGDQNILAEIEQIRRFLQGADVRSEDVSGQGGGRRNVSETSKTLTEKIDMLDQLEAQARESEDKSLLEGIRRLRSDLINTLRDHNGKKPDMTVDPEEDPIIRRMGMSEYLKYLFNTMLLQAVREKEQTKRSIQEAGDLLAEAQNRGEFDLTIRMDIKRDELEYYYGKLNQYEVWLRENFPKEFRVELDQWAAFSGYGISNINFSRIKDADMRIARISNTIDALDRVFKTKRDDLELRIKGLLSDVAKIEERMRQEAERKEQLEKEQFFKSEYFERQRQESKAGKILESAKSEKKGKE